MVPTGTDDVAEKLGEMLTVVSESTRVKDRITSSSPRWNGVRCPELVAGSRKQVEVVVMV
jgi:hypothetical protein